ncbi:MAG: adenylate/guanylate cyclase domain-containing protein, partial [Deltaproteobacteria bacterium]|nr:adenylate/guanylate cyclase domain-containing protein [Deltaproteobacteria bacterium]
RIGIQLGDVIVQGEQIYGDGVNIAARLEALAEPGGVCVSDTVHDQVRHTLPYAYEDLGEQSLKNVADPVRVYRLQRTDGDAPDGAPNLTVPGFAGRPAIAVLALDNLSGDPEQEYFADGIAEDLITRLSAVRLYPVIARNSSFVYKGRSVDVKQVSRELGVRYVIEGSVRKVADRVRITAQLIDATTGHHLWAERYDRTLRDVFALQDEIVDSILMALQKTLEKAERERAIRKAPQNLDAWDCVQRGWWHLLRSTREEVAKGQALFHKATELDPHFSLAFSGLALGHLYELGYQWSGSPQESLAASLRAAERAVALADDEPQAHVALGLARANAGQYEQAASASERVIELNPSAAVGYWCLGRSLSYLGRPDEGVGLIEKAIRLSPHDPVMHEFLFDLGVAHFLAERYEQAIVWERKSLRARPDQPGVYRVLAASYGHLGRVEEARAALDGMNELAPDFSLQALRVHVPSAVVERYLEGWRKAGWTG